MIDSNQRRILIETAKKSIQEGFKTPGQALWVPPHDGVDPQLLEPCGAFVTLFEENGDLRGCIGSLRATRPLIDDVAYNAHMAAFGDSRFYPLLPDEAGRLQIEISVLSSLQKIFPRNESEFFEMLQPGVTGLVIQKGILGATFLPSVWEQLPGKIDFFEALKRKAGINTNGWDTEMEFYTYSVEKIKSDEFE